MHHFVITYSKVCGDYLRNISLNISFIIGFLSWVEFYNKCGKGFDEYPPPGFFDRENVEIGIMLSNSFEYNYHWFDVYHHEFIHYLHWLINGHEITDQLDNICRYAKSKGYDLFEEFLPLEELHTKKLKHIRNVELADALVIGDGDLAQCVYETLSDSNAYSKVKWNAKDYCENLVVRYLHICYSSDHNFLDKTLFLIDEYKADCVFIHSEVEKNLFIELKENMDLHTHALSYCPLKTPEMLFQNNNRIFIFRESHCGFVMQMGPYRDEPRENLKKAGFQIKDANPWCGTPGDQFCEKECFDPDDEEARAGTI